jgi:hypothetical protein
MVNPTDMTPREHTLRMVLMIAACFAVGSIGVFAAVYLQSISAQQKIDASAVHELKLTQSQKDAVLQSLAALNTGTSTKSVANNHMPPSQADIHDPRAAMKLKVLESL